MEHKHNVHDTDAHFLIDPITRTIKNTSDKKLTVIQHDHNSERFTFEMPRFVDGHDMTLCDRAEIHFINIDAAKTNQSAGIYEIDDIAVNADNIVFSWLISQSATMYAGTLNFLVRFVCLSGDVVTYAWHTGVSTDFKVSGGLLNDAAEIIEPYIDVLAQWKASLFGVGDTEEQRLLSVSQDQQAAIEAKGAAVLASIPAEYADLSALVDDNFRHKAGAIIQSAAGEIIAVSDASEYPVSALTVYGRSTQDRTPTPENPVDIVSIENPVITIDGGAELQTVNIPRTLRGIPVASGGNYTDENGKQWIADEIDFERGVYVQNVLEVAVDGSENWQETDGEFYLHITDQGAVDGENPQCISSHYPGKSRFDVFDNKDAESYTGIAVRDNYIRLVDNVNFNNGVTALKNWLSAKAAENKPLTVLYILKTPIETPLSDAEISAFRALHTNKPNTTILNDSGAYMAAEYVADTKTYIDNKIAEMIGGENE